jgi:hypothetical protein
MLAPERSHRLSKSRFVAGLQCTKLLWWRTHEPESPELVPGSGLQVIFERGHRIGELARERFPGGILISDDQSPPERVAATAAALAEGVPAIFEASFIADDVFVAVDILERRRDGSGFVLVEVKSTLDVKDAQIPDVAIQLHVLERAGLKVRRAEVMHLNRACRYPDLSKLFARETVTRQARAAKKDFPARVQSQLSALAGPLPDVPTGEHCESPYACPFMERCWPPLPDHHVSTLHGIRRSLVAKLVGKGRETLFELPRSFPAKNPARRQIRSVRLGKPIVERTLKKALKRMKEPIAFLDFETVAPAIPAWPGCSPYLGVPVQLSCHLLDGGTVTHRAWLASGPADPREAIARELLSTCDGAATVLAYSAPFETRCIAGLAKAVPALADELEDLSSRIEDLLPLVRDRVYHPDFGGSFSIKSVLPALVPGLDYSDLEVQEGATASALLEALLLDEGRFNPEERSRLRKQLTDYCERDTLAMVKLWERLRELADLR